MESVLAESQSIYIDPVSVSVKMSLLEKGEKIWNKKYSWIILENRL